jgi:hypothetical protein
LIRRIMVAAQVAGTLPAVDCCRHDGAQSLQRVLQTDLGFDYERAAVLSIRAWTIRDHGDAARSFWYAVKDRVKATIQKLTMPPSSPRRHLAARVFETGYDAAPHV